MISFGFKIYPIISAVCHILRHLCSPHPFALAGGGNAGKRGIEGLAGVGGIDALHLQDRRNSLGLNYLAVFKGHHIAGQVRGKKRPTFGSAVSDIFLVLAVGSQGGFGNADGAALTQHRIAAGGHGDASRVVTVGNHVAAGVPGDFDWTQDGIGISAAFR